MCVAIRCSKRATLAIIMHVESSKDTEIYHRPYDFLRKVTYCDEDFGFFYRSLAGNYTIIETKILVPHGVDSLV